MQRRADFLVIGSGIAGLRAAIDLAEDGLVTVLTKADPSESNTGYAQGGIAAALGPGDTPELHAADTLAAGDGLCAEPAVRVLVEDGARYVRELAEWGVAFDRDETGAFALGREGAHGLRRVLHAADATGREIARVLWERASAHPNIVIEQHARAASLVLRDERCVGAAFERGDAVEVKDAAAVLLATGGACQIYSETSNPPVATGDGVALAWRAGARITDMEFVQFHPTVMDVPGAPRFLLSEAMRGEGARLLNASGERFMSRYHPEGELASRDIVARAIVDEQRRTGGPVLLSVAHLAPDYVRRRFPTIVAACRAAGVDLTIQAVPVGPAAHYMMGGVETDLWGRTTVPGLFAAGEVACTGVHGANRLASNSLLEGLVFGARAAHAMRQPPQPGGMGSPVVTVSAPGPSAPGGPPPSEADVRRLMWEHVGISRDAASLAGAVEWLHRWQAVLEPRVAAGRLSPADWRVSSLVCVGGLVARAALRREESRGAHARSDFPARDDVHWMVHVGEVTGRHGSQVRTG